MCAHKFLASAYAVEVPNRSASNLLNVLRNVISPNVTNSIQHLRRFAKPEFLPRHIQSIDRNVDEADVSELSREQPTSSPAKTSTTSHVLLCPTHAISLQSLADTLEKHGGLFSPLPIRIYEVNVPVFAPTSAIQAAKWSEEYWPTIYKNTNPYGPHPALIRRAEIEVLADGEADAYIHLAHRVAQDSLSTYPNQKVGAVIVERVSGSKSTRVVSVAADQRSVGPDDEVSGHDSNVMGHAVLRAISMVARKRRMLAQQLDSTASDNSVSAEEPQLLDPQIELEPFASSALSKLEEDYIMAKDNLEPHGYLCVDMEIYLTHEPCVMCAMAILHSRFARVVYETQMAKTGALSAEPNSLGHGLFWRDQLNWKFLAWQWHVDEASTSDLDFHA